MIFCSAVYYSDDPFRLTGSQLHMVDDLGLKQITEVVLATKIEDFWLY